MLHPGCKHLILVWACPALFPVVATVEASINKEMKWHAPMGGGYPGIAIVCI